MIFELVLTMIAIFVGLVVFMPIGALVVLAEGQQRSGKEGGSVWSHNAGGPYIRNRAIPTNPNTDAQVAVRNAITSISIAWNQTLTQVQRDAWDTYGLNVPWTNRLGQSINLKGLAHYIRCNVPRVQSGIARIDVAPTIFLLAEADTQLSATASEATQQVTVDGDAAHAWIGEAAAWCFIYMGAPQNASRKFFGSPYRLLSAVPGAGPPPFPAVINTVWPFALDQRIWIRTRIARGDGRLSEFAQTNFLGIA